MKMVQVKYKGSSGDSHDRRPDPRPRTPPPPRLAALLELRRHHQRPQLSAQQLFRVPVRVHHPAIGLLVLHHRPVEEPVAWEFALDFSPNRHGFARFSPLLPRKKISHQCQGVYLAFLFSFGPEVRWHFGLW